MGHDRVGRSKVMENRKYSKSFLLFTHIVLGGVLAFFTVAWTSEYSKNIFEGYIVSGLVLLAYIFVLRKSASLFSKGSVGAAYFLAISAFISLAFIEMINCSNSVNWMH